MKPKVIEGTWEEITLRGPELAGHRVRVTVLDDPATPAAPTGRPGDTRIPDHLLDDDAIASCEREADDRVTLDQVRAGTASIQDSMARVVTEEERAERF